MLLKLPPPAVSSIWPRTCSLYATAVPAGLTGTMLTMVSADAPTMSLSVSYGATFGPMIAMRSPDWTSLVIA